MHNLRDHIIHSYGLIFYQAGQKELSGQIFGLFLSSEKEALALDDIVAALHVSKGPVSQCMRILLGDGLLKQVRIKGQRRRYYRFADRVWLAASRLFLKPIQEQIELAQMATSAQPDGVLEEHLIDRLKDMQKSLTQQSIALLSSGIR